MGHYLKVGHTGHVTASRKNNKKGLELTFCVQGVVNAKGRREVLSCIRFHCLSNTLYVCCKDSLKNYICYLFEA